MESLIESFRKLYESYMSVFQEDQSKFFLFNAILTSSEIENIRQAKPMAVAENCLQIFFLQFFFSIIPILNCKIKKII